MAKLNYCPNCGEPIKENYKVCPACGEPLQEDSHQDTDPFEERTERSFEQSYQQHPDYKPEGNTFGWAVLGFFFPVVGLILYLVWQTDRPLASKSAGTGALVSVVIGLLSFMFLTTMAGALY
ncbi:MAG: zinc-ribbon domain-containing protein [Bacillota bacterium]